MYTKPTVFDCSNETFRKYFSFLFNFSSLVFTFPPPLVWRLERYFVWQMCCLSFAFKKRVFFPNFALLFILKEDYKLDMIDELKAGFNVRMETFSLLDSKLWLKHERFENTKARDITLTRHEKVNKNILPNARTKSIIG